MRLIPKLDPGRGTGCGASSQETETGGSIIVNGKQSFYIMSSKQAGAI